jgi:two-component system response regulator PilR (NtrC family)
LRVPPLRERPEDIPDLATHVLARLAEREGGAIRQLSPDALAALSRHAFPGNVRELENLLERACALCEGDQICADDLDLQQCEGLVQTGAGFDIAEEDDAADSDDERIKVLRALDENRWNRSAAARQLGMTLRQLRYRLQKWGMD